MIDLKDNKYTIPYGPTIDKFTIFYIYSKGEVIFSGHLLEYEDYCKKNPSIAEYACIERYFDEEAYDKAMKEYEEQKENAVDALREDILSELQIEKTTPHVKLYDTCYKYGHLHRRSIFFEMVKEVFEDAGILT